MLGMSVRICAYYVYTSEHLYAQTYICDGDIYIHTCVCVFVCVILTVGDIRFGLATPTFFLRAKRAFNSAVGTDTCNHKHMHKHTNHTMIK